MAGIEPAEDSADLDRLSYLDGRGDRFVCGPQPARMLHAYYAPAGDRAGERHDSRPSRADALPRRTRQVDSAVPGQPRPGWRIEGADDRYRAGQRRRPLWSHRRGGCSVEWL